MIAQLEVAEAMTSDALRTMPPGPPTDGAFEAIKVSPPIDALGWQLFGCAEQPKGAPRVREMAGVRVIEHTIERCSGRRLGTSEGPSIFAIVYIVEGLEWGYGAGGRCLVKTGDVLTWHTSHSLGFEVIEPVRKVSFLFDADAIASLLPAPPNLCDMHVPAASALGPMFAGYFAGLVSQLDTMAPRYHADAMAMTLEIVSTGLRRDRASVAKGPPEVLLDRIEALIDRSIDDPRLSAESIAAAHGISARYLDALFEQKGMRVADYLRERRLVGCRDTIARMAHAVNLVDLARKWGFDDATRLAHEFRRRFGASPDEYRMLRGFIGSAE